MHAIQISFIANTLFWTVYFMRDFPSYRKVYKKLPNMKFCRQGDYVVSFDTGRLYDPFIWHPKKNHFHLSDGAMLLNNIATCFSPYSFYWMMKYQRWFRKNIKVEDLKDIDTILAEQISLIKSKNTEK